MSTNSITRRRFVGGVAAATASVTLLPSGHLFGAKAPSKRINVAQIGAGGKGWTDVRMSEKAGGTIVALCDVDSRRASKAFSQYPKAGRFKDFRKMLDTMGKDIDAVVVSTPDHTHAVAAMRAITMGKHVYVQKPLTHSVSEARALRKAAAKYKVATQMGNQGHSSGGNQPTAEYIRAGAIGTVREVHVWTNRPIWPQGIARPAAQPVPDGLDWDLWVGPAPMRPYNEAYVPFKWRGWWDFGTGALGDMACHHMDSPFFCLGLTAPTSIKAECSTFDGDCFPSWSIIEYEFPAVGKRPAVKLTWYDGGKKPPRPAELEKNRKLASNGVLYVGDTGRMLGGGGGRPCRIIPEEKMQAFPRPERVLPRPGGHYSDWIDACKGVVRDGRVVKGGTNFEYSGPLTEAVVLGNLGLHYPARKLLWDAETMKVTNVPEANQFIKRNYRRGWSL